MGRRMAAAKANQSGATASPNLLRNAKNRIKSQGLGITTPLVTSGRHVHWRIFYGPPDRCFNWAFKGRYFASAFYLT